MTKVSYLPTSREFDSDVGFTNPVFLDGDGDGAWTPADPAR